MRPVALADGADRGCWPLAVAHGEKRTGPSFGEVTRLSFCFGLARGRARGGLVPADGASSQFDLVIYGGTPAGIGAAIAAARANGTLRIAVVEPSSQIGGMASAGGIGFRDIGVLSIVNSTALAWANRNALHYGVDYPVWQPDHFVGNASFWALLGQHPGVTVVLSERVRERGGVSMSGSRIVSITTAGPTGGGADQRTFEGAYFIDASYEGDVMRFSGARHTWGREPATRYNESLGGVTASSTNPFPGSVGALWPNGTLLDWVQDGPDPRKVVGEADDNVMAYSFRLCLTKRADNRVPIQAPPGYSTERFELARRYASAAGGEPHSPWGNLPYRSYPPGDKFDACCGNSPMGIDAAGLARGYANGTYAERDAIAAAHRFYVQGLAFFYMADPNSGVPPAMREALAEYGLCKDEWPEHGHWPPQLYVREAARLVGDAVFSQNDRVSSASPGGCRENSIGTGAWGFDIHQMQRPVVGGGNAFNEGLTDPGTGGKPVYEIPYSVLLPRRQDCTNLAVPNCPSVSHVAFAALREEPTLVQLGEAAGSAAALALSHSNAALQDVNPLQLQAALRELGVVVHFPERRNCSSPMPWQCQTFRVSGAGDSACNGAYALVRGLERDGAPVWRLDEAHELYRWEGDWRVAHEGESLFYAAGGGAAPPPTGWTAQDAPAPAPSVECSALA